MKLGKSGKRSAVSVLQDITSTSPKRAQRYRCAHKNWTSGEDRSVKRTLIINAKLSEHQYLLIRSASQSYNANISSFKNKILEAKRKCLPVATIVTENSAEIKLRCTLDLTTQRICSYQSSVLQTVPNESKSFTMICKRGCDSSSGQSNYKQRFVEEDQQDCSIFILSFVPLHLYCQIKSNQETKSSTISNEILPSN
ncbi:hypothetical protein ILUMI_05489 [Ignelater luminosus]|uniref:Uncharacterized protein n=1 Tax=Ignelater luminosus TaxID=2038154 RepID=A0A8K0GGB5_IGNLU|nr:hypothetical protein ILUMI_05489 [Ignelater luminosus]